MIVVAVIVAKLKTALGFVITVIVIVSPLT
jgi:hypothetical protein